MHKVHLFSLFVLAYVLMEYTYNSVIGKETVRTDNSCSGFVWSQMAATMKSAFIKVLMSTEAKRCPCSSFTAEESSYMYIFSSTGTHIVCFYHCAFVSRPNWCWLRTHNIWFFADIFQHIWPMPILICIQYIPPNCREHCLSCCEINILYLHLSN